VRILYVITTPDHGGAQVNVLDLMSGWSENVEVVLATGGEGFLTDQARSLGIDVRLLSDLVRPVRPVKDWRAYRAVRALIRSVGPDIVHCHSSKAGLIGRLAACAEGVPVVFTVHGWPFEQGISLPWRMTGLISEHVASRVCRSQHVITVAEADRQLALRKRVQPARRMTTVHNGITDTELRAEPGGGDPPILVMVARFFEQKDHDSLLRALDGIEQPFRMLFVGDGPRLETVKALAGDLHLHDRVDFLGDRHDVPELLAGAQLFVLSSLWEGFPISILEAMRAGLPVVACDVGGVKESVIERQTGFLVEPRDVEGLRRAIERMLRDPELRQRLGAAGRALFERQFGKAQMLEKTQAVYRKLLKDRSQ
jgi:glycosyltransferase involved in cell wall biosynthesis